MRVLQLVHGFPPRERAGTETYAARLADALRKRGDDVHTLAATRWPGRRMYEVIEEPGLTRIVNNAPYAGVRLGERNLACRAILEEVIGKFRPDVVHVQHPMFLDTGFDTRTPLVWTLHDAWGWCAAGGQLLKDGAACEGPGADCAGCASAWVRDAPGAAALVAGAGRLSHLVSAERLHRVWQRVPSGLRAAVTSGAGPVEARQIEARTRNLAEFAHRCAALISPSRWYADEAVRQGFPSPIVIPHGCDLGPTRVGGGPFVSLGTLAEHKGHHLVRAAWERAGVATPLRIHGPSGADAAYVSGLRADGVVDDVPALLAHARALVMGSIWPENAPLVVLEARASGCPVVAPRIGGLPEIVEDGVDGWLYPAGDVAALADCLRSAETETLRVRPPPTFGEHVERVVGVYRSVG